MSASIIPPGTEIGRQLRAAAQCRVVLIAGLPGTGKSLMFQQLTILTHEAGRKVHTMQWDDARRAFETDHWLSQYPEVDDLTHPGVRKAVGLWVREGVDRWDGEHPEPDNLLIIELPVIGGRFVELLQKQDDKVEKLLAAQQTMVLVPIPTNALRRRIEGFRADTFANPRNADEEKDAPPYIVQDLWLNMRRLYNRWTGIEDDNARDKTYDETVVRSVFERFCRFRNTALLTIDQVFETTGSAYERPVPVTPFRANPGEVEAAYAHLQSKFPGSEAQHATDGWENF